MELKTERSKRKTLLWIGLAVLVSAVLALGAYGYRQYSLPKFQDVTIELGEAFPETDVFLTPYAKPDKVQLQTGADQVDLTRAGQHTLTFLYGGRAHTVTLSVADTTPPEELVLREVYAYPGETVRVEDFVADVEDLSPVTFAFVQPPAGEGSQVPVQICVSDICGNSTTGKTTLHYTWLWEQVTLELGQTLKKEDILLRPQLDSGLIDQAALDQINDSGVGTYEISGVRDGDSRSCQVTVVDTTAPRLVVEDVSAYPDQQVELSDFVVFYSDVSGAVEVYFQEEPDLSVGQHRVQIAAKDSSGNITVETANLVISQDTVPPEFFGMTQMLIEKGQQPDYFAGVSAVDAKDGPVELHCDADNVDVNQAGIYYVTYHAQDLSGNIGTYRRKLEVLHDAQDTKDLVEDIAEDLEADPEVIRDFVRNTISYSASWGGEDPLWTGLKNKAGNCYVHAVCLQELLEKKGFETQLIWTKNLDSQGRPQHYWVLVKLETGWKHIDATPGTLHSEYSLMNDEQRYDSLWKAGVQRDWDRSLWPACE